jgi:hypothetical protein
VVQERVNYQVVLDEKPETFNLFVLWIFHSPEFVVTGGEACFHGLSLTVQAILKNCYEWRRNMKFPLLRGTSA